LLSLYLCTAENSVNCVYNTCFVHFFVFLLLINVSVRRAVVRRLTEAELDRANELWVHYILSPILGNSDKRWLKCVSWGQEMAQNGGGSGVGFRKS
jgi:hypothetical protein